MISNEYYYLIQFKQYVVLVFGISAIYLRDKLYVLLAISLFVIYVRYCYVHMGNIVELY